MFSKLHRQQVSIWIQTGVSLIIMQSLCTFKVHMVWMQRPLHLPTSMERDYKVCSGMHRSYCNPTSWFIVENVAVAVGWFVRRKTNERNRHVSYCMCTDSIKFSLTFFTNHSLQSLGACTVDPVPSSLRGDMALTGSGKIWNNHTVFPSFSRWAINTRMAL